MNPHNPLLIAELGATKARLAITVDNISFIKQVNYYIKEFNTVEAIFKNYLNKINISVKKAIIGVAAPITGDEVAFVNLDLKFSQSNLKESIFQESLLVLNDVELQAYGIESLDREKIFIIGNQKKPLSQSKVLVSPGTGLGLAGIVGGIITPTEAGHLNIPANLPKLSSIVKKFQTEKNRMPIFEDFLSGKGINYIYRHLSKSKLKPYSNEEILSKNEDPDCNKTKYLMQYLLAVYLRYMALIWGATGGVYLSGSIVNSLLQEANFKQFRDDFEDSPTMNSLLIEIPIFLIKELNLGFKGALKLASSS